MTPSRIITTILMSLTFPSAISALTFHYTNIPSQCGNLTIKWEGGTPPFTLLLVPTGHMIPETRTIIERVIPSGNSASLVLNYPDQSEFVTVLYDATGIGSGCTSIVTTVNPSTDSSCLSRTNSSPKFFFYLPNTINQCDIVDISWNSAAENPVDILGLIPGGQSFEIANITDYSTSFNWTVNVRSGTDVILIAGDIDGLGSGGSSDIMSIGDGSSDCVDNSSPSSTFGNSVEVVTHVTQGWQSSSISSKSTDITSLLASSSDVETSVIIGTSTSPTTVGTSATKSPITSIIPGSGVSSVTGPSERGSREGQDLTLILGLVFGILAFLGTLIGYYIIRRHKQGDGPYKIVDPEASDSTHRGQRWIAAFSRHFGTDDNTESTGSLPSMYQTEPFVSPPGYDPYYTLMTYKQTQHQRPSLVSRISSSYSSNSYQIGTSSRELFGSGPIAIHGLDRKFRSSGRPQGRQGRVLDIEDVKSSIPIETLTRVARESDGLNLDFEDVYSSSPEVRSVDIPPTYTSICCQNVKSGDDEPLHVWAEGSKLSRSNAIRMKGSKRTPFENLRSKTN